MTHEPCLERHPKHDVSRYEHVRKQVSEHCHLDRCETVQLSSPCQPNATLLVPRQSMLRHVVTWRCETSSRQCSGVIHSPVVGHVTLTRISSKLPAARSLPRPSRDCGRRSRKANDVMELQTTSCHDLTCGAVSLQYCVKVLRHSVFFVCLSVEHAAKLACPQRYHCCIFTL